MRRASGRPKCGLMRPATCSSKVLPSPQSVSQTSRSSAWFLRGSTMPTQRRAGAPSAGARGAVARGRALKSAPRARTSTGGGRPIPCQRQNASRSSRLAAESAHTRSKRARSFTYSGWRATLCGQVVWGNRSGMRSWKMAAARHRLPARNPVKPGRSASENNSAVRNQSEGPAAQSHRPHSTGAAAAPNSSRSRALTRIRPERCAPVPDLVASKKIIGAPRRSPARTARAGAPHSCARQSCR